jgi:CubicO group peptidase (beta-lactamase class C family)
MHRSPRLTAAVLAALVLLGVLAAYGPAAWRSYLDALSQRSAPLYQPRERVTGGNEPPAPRVAPALEQLDPQALESAASYAGAHGSRALIVARNDHIVFERYWGGTQFDTVSDGQDFTALLAVLATGVAVSHRRIGWPDEPLSLLVTEWREDPRGAITVRNLMQRSSGLAPGADLRGSADLTATVLGIPLQGLPGVARVPRPSDAQLLALALERATGERYAQFVSTALWRRLGAADAYLWLDHPGGLPHADCCMFARQGDWIRVGQLLVRDGAYRGQQLMRPGWVTFMRTPARSDADFGSFVRVSLRPSARGEPYAARDAFAVGEEGGNRMWIVPSLQLAIVCTGPAQGRAADWDEVRIPNLIIGAARDQAPAAAAPGEVSALVPGH